MTPNQITEITRKARQDAAAVKAWWPYRGNPYHTQAEADLYTEIFEVALKENKK